MSRFTGADFDAPPDTLGEPVTAPQVGTGSPSAAEPPIGAGGDGQALEPPAAALDAPAGLPAVPCPIPGCGTTIQAGQPFRALQEHLEAEHGLIPTEPRDPRPVPPQLTLPDTDADLAALFDAPIDPQTGNAVMRMPEPA